jgi:hypothetical protein
MNKSAVEDLPLLASFGVLVGVPRRLLCAYMKKTHNKAKQHRFFRRFVRQLFSSLIKRQNCNCLEEIQKVIEMLREIEDSIEIIARQIARQIKSGK